MSSPFHPSAHSTADHILRSGVSDGAAAAVAAAGLAAECDDLRAVLSSERGAHLQSHAALEAELSVLRSAYSDAKHELKGSARSAETDSRLARSEHSSLKMRHRQLLAKQATADETIKGLTAVVEEQASRRQREILNRNRSEARCSSMRTTESSLRSELDSARAQLIEARDAAGAVNAAVDAARRELSRMRDRLTRAEGELSRGRSNERELERVRAHNLALEEEVAALRQEVGTSGELAARCREAEAALERERRERTKHARARHELLTQDGQGFALGDAVERRSPSGADRRSRSRSPIKWPGSGGHNASPFPGSGGPNASPFLPPPPAGPLATPQHTGWGQAMTTAPPGAGGQTPRLETDEDAAAAGAAAGAAAARADSGGALAGGPAQSPLALMRSPLSRGGGAEGGMEGLRQAAYQAALLRDVVR